MPKLISCFALILILVHVAPVFGIVVETTEEAADDLGYQIVGEVEFAPKASQVPARVIETTARDATIVCPGLDARHGRLDRAHLVVMAWADHEYPANSPSAHESEHRELAHRRAEGVAAAMRQRLTGELSFDLVNMATRGRHEIPLGGRSLRDGHVDVKGALVRAGAAPSSALETGLFGEYAQASKAVIWIDCEEPRATPRATPLAAVKFAGVRPLLLPKDQL